ncbi:MAG: hypothetical protein ACE15D_16990 [Candidatus Eisenbacteria bacterium]|nr:hypothetical protein [Candidatus Eisenbacteria bacterium]
MQKEIDEATGPGARPVHIHGVNEIGRESGIPGMCEGRVLPLVQDDEQAKVWDRWEVTYRDVVIVGPDGQRVDVYNLTQHGLQEPANYDTLKARILRIAAH